MSFLPKLERYKVQQVNWPYSGRHILSQFDDDSIIVYQMVVDPTRKSSEEKYDRTKGDNERSQKEGRDLNGNEETKTESTVLKRCETVSSQNRLSVSDQSEPEETVRDQCEPEETVPDHCEPEETVSSHHEIKAAMHNQHGSEATVPKQRKTTANMPIHYETEATMRNQCDIRVNMHNESETKASVPNQNVTEATVPSGSEVKPVMSKQEVHVYENVEIKHQRENAEQQPEDFLRLQTSFLQAMVRCEWGKWSEHGKVFAIRMKREGFEELLRVYVEDIKKKQLQGDVTVEWNPDRSPTGEMLKRFVPELGIRGRMLKQFINVWIMKMKDISEYVRHLRRSVETGRAMLIWTPVEIVYSPGSADVCSSLAIETKVPGVTDDNIEVKGMEHLCETLAEAYARVPNSNISVSSSHSRDAILYLYGAFNPVHLGHVNALVESKRWLETKGQFHVCDVRIALVSDNSIKGKFSKTGDQCIKFEHRFKLCKIACLDYPWITIHPVPVTSQGKVGEQIRQEINKPAAILAILVGSDRAFLSKRKLKQKRNQNRVILCIGRKGMTPADLGAFKKAEKNDPKHSLDFFVVPTEFNEISSTLIRQKLDQVIGANAVSAQDSKNSIFKEMAEKGWIRQEQGEYILQHLDNMFL